MRHYAICLGPADDVANVLAAVAPAETVELIGLSGAVVVSSPVQIYHKIAVRNLAKGVRVIRGGLCIGATTKDIAKGDHVHVHNMRSLRAITSDGEAA